MIKELQYPFDGEYLLKKSKQIKRILLEDGTSRLEKKIAVLGGSTTHDVVRILTLFLLNEGIAPTFYESEYGQYYGDAMFDNEALQSFAPDLIYIHTSLRNIGQWPCMGDTEESVSFLFEAQYKHFEGMWEKLAHTFHCPIIQNNFEYPFYRLMGNQEASDIHGRIHYINRLNDHFYAYAREHTDFFINDINYMAATYGLEKWADPFYWHMYKYAMCIQAIPDFSANLSHIIKAIFGKNKKALVVDLDNTLWGGIVGDDGPENLEIGQETSQGQVYYEFQQYVKAHKEIGVILNVNSKNEEDNAMAGLHHPDGALRPEDFVVIKANWEPKSENIKAIAKTLDLLPEALVFVDDNPAEREIVRDHVSGVGVPEIGTPECYIKVLDRSGYFEVVGLSQEDQNRSAMYQANQTREAAQSSFDDYPSYLRALQMKAIIKPFDEMYMARIAQLTNKSNQFNLTTKRYTLSQIEQTAHAKEYITLYGKLEDKFGDNGVVSVLIGRKEDHHLHIELWLMSCRVLKRDMEYAMMDVLVEQCKNQEMHTIKGYYVPTAKNNMVHNFYERMGFEKIKETPEGSTTWQLELEEIYINKNKTIKINTQSETTQRKDGTEL